jgi:hypothetical protein
MSQLVKIIPGSLTLVCLLSQIMFLKSPDFIKSSKILDFLLCIKNALNWPLHVGLPGTDPDISKKNVLNDKLILSVLIDSNLTVVSFCYRVENDCPFVASLEAYCKMSFSLVVAPSVPWHSEISLLYFILGNPQLLACVFVCLLSQDQSCDGVSNKPIFSMFCNYKGEQRNKCIINVQSCVETQSGQKTFVKNYSHF